MTPAYDADSALDAQLVADLLTGAGIAAHVFGAALSGAVGELPPGGLVRVWIEDDSRLTEAQALIHDWSGAAIPDEAELERLALAAIDGGEGEFYA
ncbi:putative signal transducing protein [Arenimonas sp. MALMAid1274]|uniref:putative signal transducing protein n=1 Tax=Arenimonas sp. MALMAid1274 TaxID=3411630 RepID=UPI003B9EC94A